MEIETVLMAPMSSTAPTGPDVDQTDSDVPMVSDAFPSDGFAMVKLNVATDQMKFLVLRKVSGVIAFFQSCDCDSSTLATQGSVSSVNKRQRKGEKRREKKRKEERECTVNFCLSCTVFIFQPSAR